MEQVATFLITVGHDLHNFLIQDIYQHFEKTASRYFHSVFQAIAAFSKEIIKPPSFKILSNTKHYPWFKDCTGTNR